MDTRFEWSGDAWMRAALEGAERGLSLGMEHVLQVSRTLVPLREGTLERSGATAVTNSGYARIEGIVSYGTPYAVRQHEELTYRHAPGRQAKYLEQPVNTEAPTVLALIAAGIRRAGGGEGLA